jgi:serine phosphatase RsbU (regulator of sigma subunit)
MSREVVLVAGLLLGGLGYSALIFYVWRYRHAAGGWSLLGILLSVFGWTTFYALEVTSRTVATAEFWSTLKFAGVVGMPPCLLVFALEYTGHRGVGRRLIALLAVVPTLTVVSFVLEPTKNLIHVYDPALRAAGELPFTPFPTLGLLFVPHAVYNYGLALAALGLTVVRSYRAGPAYRTQAVMVAVAAAVPLGANMLYVAGLFGEDAKDPVPFLFALLAVVLVWGFFRQELLDVVPVARDLVLEQLVDGVVVLDVHDRVVDANAAAGVLFGVRTARLVGRYLRDLFPAAAGLFEDGVGDGFRDGVGRPALRPRQADVMVPARPGVPARDVAVNVTPLVVRSAPAGRVLLLHDVTEREAAQRRLHELLDEQTRVAETLQASLRPRSLPAVPGLQLAARSLPAGPGARGSGHVSGDFYDVHRVLGGDWAFAVGDVSGKGVEAAVVTSMARWTVRTLSAEGRAPRQVLERLNRVLLGDESSERFCTLAYGRIAGADLLRSGDMGGIAGAPSTDDAGVTVRLVLGGHPEPLLRRRDGHVESVGRPGTALGLLPSVDVEEARLVLTSQDVLLLYTDGVTEARRGSEQFGEDRLAEVLAASAVGLRGRTGAAAAHLVAEAVAERVLAEVTGWASRRDDVAVLVLAVP